MKKLIVLLIAITILNSMRINLSPALYIRNDGGWSEDIKCSGADGNVQYRVDGLPRSIQLKQNVLFLDGKIKQGRYPIRLTAKDSKGNADEKVIVIIANSNAEGSAQESLKGRVFGLPSSTIESGLANGANVLASSSSSSSLFSKQTTHSLNTINSQSSTSTTFQSSSASLGNSGSSGNQISSTVSINRSPSLDNLLSTYAGGNIQNIQIKSNSNTYPTINFPTGRDPNAPINYTPELIMRAQAQKSSQDKNKITQDDTLKRAILERSITASKNVANLINLVQQSTANRNRANEQINKFTLLYNQAIQAQRSIQNTVVTNERNLAKIKTAIENIRNVIIQIESQITIKQKQRTQIVTSQTTIEMQMKKNKNSADAIDNQLNLMLRSSSDMNGKIQIIKNSMQSIKTKIEVSRTTLNNAQQKLSLVPTQKNAVRTKINKINDRIDQLNRQIKLQQRQLVTAKAQLTQIEKTQIQAPRIISNAQSEINSYNQQLLRSTTQMNQMQKQQNQIEQTIIPGLRDQMRRINSQISDQNLRMTNFSTSVTTTIEQNIQQLSSKLQQSRIDLAYLSDQIPEFEIRLKRSYQAGNDANNVVVSAKENLNAIVQRYQTQIKSVAEVTARLEKARAQKQVADLAVQQLLAQRTNVLPYAIAPINFGQVAGASQNADGSFAITNWTYFISNSFGAGVSCPYNGNVNTLHPIALANIQLRSGGFISGGDNIAQFPCNGGYGTLLSDSGTITSIYRDGFQVRDLKGRNQNIHIAPCTKLLGNRPNYEPKIGDSIMYKGFVDQAGNNWKTQQVVCLH